MEARGTVGNLDSNKRPQVHPGILVPTPSLWNCFKHPWVTGGDLHPPYSIPTALQAILMSAKFISLFPKLIREWRCPSFYLRLSRQHSQLSQNLAGLKTVRCVVARGPARQVVSPWRQDAVLKSPLFSVLQKNIAVENDVRINKDDLTDLYVQHAIPLPRRDLPKNRWGKMMEKKREQHEIKNDTKR